MKQEEHGRDRWPPGNVGGGPTPEAANTTTNNSTPVEARRSSNFINVGTQLRRRRAASWRLPPLDCGCRDPWPCRCTRQPLTDRELDGWRDAALYVLAIGEVPLLPIEVRRALYRRGAADRALAVELHDLCGRETA